MPTLDPRTSTLALIDFQIKLMPVIDRGDATVANARKLADAAAMVGVPVIYTEQYPKGLGPTVPELAVPAGAPLPKMCFGAVEADGFLDRLGEDHAVVLAGVEAHICVLQTALGLLLAVLSDRLARSVALRAVIIAPYLMSNVVAELVWMLLLDPILGLTNA